jgi:hypothetical protein
MSVGWWQVGDEVAAADPAPSEAQNYFAMLLETPAALLVQLVAQRGCGDATAERVAALLGCDLVSLGALRHLCCPGAAGPQQLA